MGRISAAQDRQYREQGFTLFRENVFPAERFNRLRELFERLVADGAHLDTPHFQEPELLDFLLDDDVLDLVEPLIGPDFGLWSSHFISKEPRTGKATPWHEDSAYWDGRFASFGGIVTVWLALDETDAGNGAMSALPGTHLEEGFTYGPCDPELNVFPEEILDLDTSGKVTFELSPNQCSLHDSRIVHGAGPNTSDRRRCGYTMRYFSQHMRFIADHPANRGFRMWHARGRNPHGNPVET